MQPSKIDAENPAMSRRSLLGHGALLAVPALLGVGCATPLQRARRTAVQPVPPPPTPGQPPMPTPASPAETVAPAELGALSVASWYPAPDLSDAAVLRHDAGLRPYRRGSYRLEAEHDAGRVLMHNYGHGGAGWTLSWGCATWIADEADALPTTTTPHTTPPARAAAVLGAGVVGLTTALALAQRGWTVTVYADRFGPTTTSMKAGAQFAPSLVATGRGPAAAARLDRLVRTSHQRFMHDHGEAAGVFRRINFAAEHAGHSLSRLPAELGQPQKLDRLPIDGLDVPGMAYHTLLIEPPRYLPYLQAQLRGHGVAFVTRRFETLEQVRTLPQPLIVNCLGMGAGAVCDDRAVIPVRGQLVHLRPQPLGYMISHRGYMFPRSDVVVLGGTVERGVDDPTPTDTACARILSTHRRFFGAATAQPQLQG